MICIARARGVACEHSATPGSPFCPVHVVAPAARRGGWISAERRRRQLGATRLVLDMTPVAASSSRSNRLWIGAQPPSDSDLPAFDVLVLCAQEYQPDRLAFHGRVIRCPLPAGALTVQQVMAAVVVASDVARCLASGKRVLVTCVAGLNRSVLVGGLALGRITRMGAGQIVQHMRARRGPQALSNPHLVSLLQSVIRR